MSGQTTRLILKAMPVRTLVGIAVVGLTLTVSLSLAFAQQPVTGVQPKPYASGSNFMSPAGYQRRVLADLAPTGKLRVALQLANPLNVVRDSVSGDMRGVGFDLGKELARRVEVPFEPVLYPAVGPLLDAGKSGAWDVAFVGYSPTRAEEWNFTGLHLEVEFGYLVPAGSAISTIADVDRPGIRMAVQENSGPDVFLTRTLRNVVMVRTSSNPAALEAVRAGRADAMGSIKPVLFELSSQLAGSRILDGRPGIDPHAMVMPKGRDLGLAYARRFIEDAKSQGLVKAAIERAGVRGVVVAAP